MIKYYKKRIEKLRASKDKLQKKKNELDRTLEELMSLKPEQMNTAIMEKIARTAFILRDIKFKLDIVDKLILQSAEQLEMWKKRV